MSAGPFMYDVFLCHSPGDRAVVGDLANRLEKDGLRVWVDGPPEQVEQALERSRVLVLCMSKRSLGPDWARLEEQTLRFRDPLNKERWFLPLRLDETRVLHPLAPFSSLDWRARAPDQYEKLLRACRPAESTPAPATETPQRPWKETIILGHTSWIRALAISPDGQFALSGALDATMRLWEVSSGRCLRIFHGHTKGIRNVAWSPDGQHALSGSDTGELMLWEISSGGWLRTFSEEEASGVSSIAWSPDGRLAAIGAGDARVRLISVAEPDHGMPRFLEVHRRSICGVAFHPDGRRIVTGSADATLRLSDVDSGTCTRVFGGHEGAVLSVAWSPDGRRIASGSGDTTVRIWDAESNEAIAVLRGHSGAVLNVAWSPDGRFIFSGSEDRTVRLWNPLTGHRVGIIRDLSDSVWAPIWDQDGTRALSTTSERSLGVWSFDNGKPTHAFEGHRLPIHTVDWSPDGRLMLSGSADNTLRLWDIASGRCLHVMTGHSSRLASVAFSPDGKLALSGSRDNTMRLWDVASGSELRELGSPSRKGTTGSFLSVGWRKDGKVAVSGSGDGTVRFWAVDTDLCLRILKGHGGGVLGVAWSPDGDHVLSNSEDGTLRIWQVETSKCLHVLTGHTGPVSAAAWSPDGRYVVSGSEDGTVRFWGVRSGRCVRVLEGHTQSVSCVTWSPNGQYALSGSGDRTLRLWETDTGKCLLVLGVHADALVRFRWRSSESFTSVSADGVINHWDLHKLFALLVAPRGGWAPGPSAEALQYTNAKVLLVGESGAGKTGLSMRLAHKTWSPTDSTAGAWATQWKLPVAPTSDTPGVEREIWLWDFGGQADQRLIHQLYMDETALAVLVFDPQKEDLFDALAQWDRDLSRAASRPFQRLLVAGRTDVGGLRVGRDKVEAFAKERGYARYLETSARTGEGCERLEAAILESIRWEDIPWRSSPRLFKVLKEEIIRLKDEGRALMRLNELRETLQLRIAPDARTFTDQELKAVVSLLAGPGVVWELSFGSWILLQPERINAYAQAVIHTLRNDQKQLGSILEEKVLSGDISYASSLPRLPRDEERIILLAMHQTLVERGLCIRDHDPNGKRATYLVFPSYYGRERPDLVGHPAAYASYRFSGFLDDIYATLVVRLHHAEPFEHAELWRYAADFKTTLGKRLGVKLTRLAEGTGELKVYFDPSVSVDDKVVFSKYVHEHLLAKAQDVQRLRHYVCPHCNTPVENRATAMKKLTEGRKYILCVDCEKQVPLWDELEERFASPEIQQRVHELQEQTKIVLDAQSKERALVGDVISTVALAGQISREFSVSDHGIDMEIEFKNDRGEATGKKLYLQLKSGDSHLRHRERDEAEIFPIKDARHTDYWMKQAFPVLLVIRNSDGEVRWMEVRDWLKRETEDGRKPVKQIVFDGERFDVMSVRRWRDRALGVA